MFILRTSLVINISKGDDIFIGSYFLHFLCTHHSRVNVCLKRQKEEYRKRTLCIIKSRENWLNAMCIRITMVAQTKMCTFANIDAYLLFCWWKPSRNYMSLYWYKSRHLIKGSVISVWLLFYSGKWHIWFIHWHLNSFTYKKVLWED